MSSQPKWVDLFGIAPGFGDGDFFEAPDGNDESTLWLRTDREPIAVLSRYQLDERLRPIWHRIVEAVVAS